MITIKTDCSINQTNNQSLGQFFDPLLFFLIFNVTHQYKVGVGHVNNQHVMWPYLYQSGTLNLVHLSSYLLTTMKPISAEKHSSIVSLLNEGYSHGQIQARMGLGKGTIGRISREVEGDKENHLGSHPSKLSPYDKQSSIHQISSGKLDNAVQATQFINSTISNSVTPQTVRNVLKEAGFRLAIKKKVPMLKRSHCQQHLKFAQYYRN